MRRGTGLCLVLAVLAGACASRHEAAARAASLASAEALLHQGCYACLREARDTFGGLLTGPLRDIALVRLFETELLILLREKELGLDWAATELRVTALAAAMPAHAEAARYLAIVDAVPPEGAGVPQVVEAQYRRARVEFMRRVDTELAWLASGPVLQPAVREYLSLALDCMHLSRPSRIGPESTRRAASPGAPPLVRFRAALCGDIRRPELEEVRAEVPRFAEASYYIARLEVAGSQRTGGAVARERLDDAYAALPRSPAVTYLLGSFRQIVGDCRDALRFYEETLALRDGYENAMIGRVVCLTYLRRPEDAMAAATVMIDRRTIGVDQAFYWRAWNLRSLGRLADARADIEQAKRLAVTVAIHVLAGMIEYDQDDLAPAEADLRTATGMPGGSGNCDARWYLGLVAIKREIWLEAGGHFRDAMRCYERAALESERALKEMETKEGLDPEFRASQIASFRLAVAEDRSQQYAAAFNAANQFARGGDRDTARALLDIAAKDPALDSRVAELRRIIGG